MMAVDAQGIDSLLARYISACEALDIDKIVECFDKDAIVSDPICATIKGRKAIAQYFQGLYEGLSSLKLCVGPAFYNGSDVACYWSGGAVRADGQEFQYQGIDVFKTTALPAISQMVAYWDPSAFAGATPRPDEPARENQ